MGPSIAKRLVTLQQNGNDNDTVRLRRRGMCDGYPSWPMALTDAAGFGVTMVLWLLLLPFASAGTVATLDDIQFWVGSGGNRAAVVIDWDDASVADKALAWGYRWDGDATGEDMLLTVLESDARLFTKLSAPSSSGTALYGLGYDNNNDGQFAISDGTTFDADGIAISGPADGGTSVDSNDLYAEGWQDGFWHYGLSSGNPFDGGSWASSGSSMSGRTLSDGNWDSWAFMTTFDFTAFAENPHSAEALLSADFDGDQDVDGADFLLWQRGFGILSGASREQGDADNDGDVDSADLQQWSSNYGLASAGSGLRSAAHSVPELSTDAYALWAIGICFFGSCYTTRRRLS